MKLTAAAFIPRAGPRSRWYARPSAHGPTLALVGHGVHLGPGQAHAAVATAVSVHDDVGYRDQITRQVVGQLLVRRTG